jgi:hypothetical protein
VIKVDWHAAAVFRKISWICIRIQKKTGSASRYESNKCGSKNQNLIKVSFFRIKMINSLSKDQDELDKMKKKEKEKKEKKLEEEGKKEGGIQLNFPGTTLVLMDWKYSKEFQFFYFYRDCDTRSTFVSPV